MFQIQVITRKSKRYATRFRFESQEAANMWLAVLKPSKGEQLRMVVK